MAHPIEKMGEGDQQLEHANSFDGKGADTDVYQAQQLASQWQEGTEAERKLVRKLDWRILPCCWVLYLLGFLDRANVGFVNPATVKKDTWSLC
jgi:hypothetical protein